MAIPKNPFSVSRVRPGAIPFIGLSKNARRQLLTDITTTENVVQIVGPHGSGKSTLVHSLLPELSAAFANIRVVTIRAATPRSVAASQNLPIGHRIDRSLLIVDGVERLPWWHRQSLLRWTRRHTTRVLLTTHVPLAGVQTIYQTETTLSTLTRIVDQLTHGQPIAFGITKTDIHETWKKSGGNIREIMMSLYDRAEWQLGAFN